VREKLKDSYSETGRPSIDPELLLRILLIGYLYGINQRAQVGGGVAMHLLALVYGLGFDQEFRITPRSRESARRFQESKLFEQLFERSWRIVWKVGSCQGDNLSVDGSFVEANANKERPHPARSG